MLGNRKSVLGVGVLCLHVPCAIAPLLQGRGSQWAAKAKVQKH